MEHQVLPPLAHALDCRELLELVPEYCLGTATPAEIAQIEASLDRCPALRLEIAAYRAITDQLLHSAPRQIAPPTLKTGVLAKIHAAPANPMPVLVAVPPALPATVTPLARRPARLTRLTGLVAALVVLLVGTNLFWWLRADDDGSPPTPPTAPIANDGSLAWFQLVGGDEVPATAWCIWSRASGQGVLVAENFPTLPPGQSYQVWINRDSEVVSMGLLEIGDDGKGILVLPDYSFKGKVAGVNVTYEPYGGSDAPTGRALVWSELNRDR